MRKNLPLNKRYEIDIITNCWNWKGNITSSGYGMIRHQGVWQGAHRVYFKIFKGYIPDKLVVDHKCKNRKCVNPDHLELITKKKNDQQGLVKINQEIADKIRAHFKRYPQEKQEYVAKLYGIDQTSVSLIKSGKIWI